MSPKPDLSDPTDLAGLRSGLASLDPDKRLASLDMLRVTISEDAHLRVAAAVGEALAAAGKHGRAAVVILADKTPIRRDGELLKRLVHAQLNDHFDVRSEELDDGREKLHADDGVLDRATELVAGADAVVTIGSGTMTDIGKVATERQGGIPQVVVQTAASVDGFTDNVSVILRNGVKRTVPSRWPTIVLADTVTISGAPREMNAAGFGEAISLFTAPADWYLASLIRLDRTFHPASLAMLQAAASVPPDWSEGIARGEAAAIGELTRLLALRGIVSGVSNTTACLSGVEHVVSHMLDLHNAAKHLPVGLHGAQVGVASLVAAKLWRHAIDNDLITLKQLRLPKHAAVEARVGKAFGQLGDDGAIAAECWRDCQAKRKRLIENWPRVVAMVEAWQRHRVDFAKLVLPADTLRRALRASGAPARIADLEPSVSPELARWALANCHLMRNRFNLVDLLDLLGLWTDDLVDWALLDVLGAAP